MRIIEYHCQEIGEPGWDFTDVKFGKINLLVGDTATGKSRFLNTIFNLGRFAVSKEFKNGHWDILFEHSGVTYKWNIKTGKKEGDDEPGIIINENIWKLEDDKLIQILERNDKTFTLEGKKMPKLSLKETSIFLLQEEDVIKPIHEAFSLIQRRLFYSDALAKAAEFQALPLQLINTIEKQRDLKKLFYTEINLSGTLHILFKYFKSTYDLIIEQYKQFFPFIEETRITDLSTIHPNIALPGHFPVFSIREHKLNKWIPFNDLSSGMQKVLLILTDIYILPEGGVYIIDEYENSLGISAIDFFPQFIFDLEKAIQFFITSHHPYIINEIPPKNWYVFHRDGMKVSIMYGEEVTKRFGKSKQQAFIQLINDPFFARNLQ